MKQYKKLMLIATMAGPLFAANVAVHAQNASNLPPATVRPPVASRLGASFDRIATMLVLTDDQKAKAKPIIDDMRGKLAGLRGDTTLDQASRHAKMQEIVADATSKLKDILTAEQFTKWQRMSSPRRPSSAGAAQPLVGTPPPASSPAAQQ